MEMFDNIISIANYGVFVQALFRYFVAKLSKQTKLSYRPPLS